MSNHQHLQAAERDAHPLTVLSEWKLQVVSELVWEVLQTNRERSRQDTWRNVAQKAVFLYDQNALSYQSGDSMFEQYEDNFINASYIYNKRTEIRDHLRINHNRIVGQSPNGQMIYAGNEDDLKDYLERQQKRASSLAQRHTRMAQLYVQETGHANGLVTFEQRPLLPDHRHSQDNRYLHQSRK